jgi:hypothetical protein
VGSAALKPTMWKIRKKSNVPREMFFKIRGFLKQGVKRCGTKSLDGVIGAGWEGLKQAGEVFGCEIKDGSKLADFYWLLDGRRLVAWQLAIEPSERGRDRDDYREVVESMP